MKLAESPKWHLIEPIETMIKLKIEMLPVGVVCGKVQELGFMHVSIRQFGLYPILISLGEWNRVRIEFVFGII